VLVAPLGNAFAWSGTDSMAGNRLGTTIWWFLRFEYYFMFLSKPRKLFLGDP
jgi:hypothetical protein